MSTSTAPVVSTWNIDPAHSVVEFKVKHMMISNVKGKFTGISGVLSLDESDITKSHGSASVEVATINTSDEQRDTHVKSAEFFDVEKFPTISLKSTKVTRKSEDTLLVNADLTIRDITHNVEFLVEGPSAPGKDPWGNTRIGLEATAKISRKEFGLVWNVTLETGGVLVSDEVSLTLDVELIKA
jgi:polyisoprenoid-binding protein YceI